MAFEAKKNRVTSSETSATIDLDLKGKGISRDKQQQIKRDVGEFIVEQINLAVTSETSPVTGESFQPLSKEYEKFKRSEGRGSDANLLFSGNMLNALDAKNTAEGIKIGVFGKDAPKADGHNNLSGRSKLPTRQFIPDKGEKFDPIITNEIEAIVKDAIAEDADFTPSAFREVKNKSGLFNVLKGLFPDLSQPEIRLVIGRNDRFQEILEDLNLLRFL